MKNMLKYDVQPCSEVHPVATEVFSSK